ncbi:MAG TPA: PAS domain-containing protein [Rhizomicrobium sp.]|jgi:hypothetical protein|nr:PAS domain-containing protein [Rhizomicrobium sp.]
MCTASAFEASEKFNARARMEAWSSFCDASLAFQRMEFRLLLATWHDLGDEEHLPSRRELTPHKLKSLLRNITIYERVTNGKVRYRVKMMGSAFADIMGDLSGQFLDEAVPQEHLPRWHAALDAVLEAGAPLRFVSRADSTGRSFVVGEYFEAPLLDDNGSPTMILAGGHFAARKWSDLTEFEPEKAHALAAA